MDKPSKQRSFKFEGVPGSDDKIIYWKASVLWNVGFLGTSKFEAAIPKYTPLLEVLPWQKQKGNLGVIAIQIHRNGFALCKKKKFECKRANYSNIHLVSYATRKERKCVCACKWMKCCLFYRRRDVRRLADQVGSVPHTLHHTLDDVRL